MKMNMGSFDRIFRLAVAAVIAFMFFTGKIEGNLGLVLMGLAGVFVLTSLVGTCPLYLPFGISTIKKKLK